MKTRETFPRVMDSARGGGVLRCFIMGILLAAGPAVLTAQDEPPEEENCLECHSDKDLTMERDGKEVSLFVDEEKLSGSVHGKNRCGECHGGLTDEHPDDGKRSLPVDCAECHEKQSASFGASVHGLALRSGNETAAGCVDCHGSHEVFAHGSEKSATHFSKLLKTCGECHTREAEDVAASVHGKATGKGVLEAPTCIDCHEEHKIGSLAGDRSIRKVGETCSRCHESERINTKFGLPSDRVETFAGSYHGLAVKGGATNAANCASCHGYHKVLPSTDPESSIHRSHLVETCGKCHPGAGENFAFGTIHATDAAHGDLGAMVNHWVRIAYLVLIFGVIGVMLLHNLMSWLRALKDWYHKRGATVMRMNLHQRMQHFVLVVTFIVLAVSGFALKYPESWLGWLFGGDEAIRRWVHRVFGIIMLAGGFWHIVYVIFTRDGRQLVRDFLPKMQDVRDVFGNLLYFVGKKPHHPRFGRFSYAEKLEYWAVVWGSVIMGVTGLMIWFKIDVTRFFPRWFIDVAITIHFYEAILACLAIVVWHFYHVLFAPGTYPMNFAWWDGKVSRKWLEEEHPLDPQATHGADEDEDDGK
ncbi:MAG TPA: cytochrome b/b6 domain-containing protein [Luteolibacter sp.]|nr:cytochrome b/b6 domain-containing protein [Luteolibacter sp.]